MLFLHNFSYTETGGQSFAVVIFLLKKIKKFHQLNPPLLRRNTGVLINLLHQAAGSDFFTI